ncbi:peptide chain release factor N(5)-glutamine methyltransferase [Candidatus Uhrbacteria bacterium]|nr:peptide chain release factor N(5)-glutamine methyltransferase [Candidatus Uhrbacteria bacterium]
MPTVQTVLASSTSRVPHRYLEVLLAHVLRKPREWVLAHPEAIVRSSPSARYRRLLRRLKQGEPLPYLLGEAWFYGRPFTVNKHVLIPRPETELLIELTVQHIRGLTAHGSRLTAIDVGTGSGCIAVTLAAELRKASIIAMDSSLSALRIARANARRHGVGNHITFLRGNLLSPVLQNPTLFNDRGKGWDSAVLVANLPYLTTAEWRALPRSIRGYEPRQALDGGPDGLKHFRELFRQLQTISGGDVTPPLHSLHSLYTFTPLHLYTFLEIDPRRKRALTALIRKTLPKWRASWHRDLAGRWRVLEISNSS